MIAGLSNGPNPSPFRYGFQVHPCSRPAPEAQYRLDQRFSAR
jgi:hypothetical protein